MKKRIPIILLTSIIIFAKQNNNTPQFLFPLDARQLTLPPLDLIHDRDFTELLGISTTAPVPDGSMYFHADIPDSILDAGPVDALYFMAMDKIVIGLKRKHIILALLDMRTLLRQWHKLLRPEIYISVYRQV